MDIPLHNQSPFGSNRSAENLPPGNQDRKQSQNQLRSSNSEAAGGSQITHRKAVAVSEQPLAQPRLTVDKQLVIKEAYILGALEGALLDNKRYLTKAEKELAKKDVELMRQEEPELFELFDKHLNKQFEQEIFPQFSEMMDLDNLMSTRGLSKNKRKGKAKVISHACREVQKMESKIKKKATDLAAIGMTRYLLEEWLKIVEQKSLNSQLAQALCDVNRLLRIIVNLKTRHPDLPELESKALRGKIFISLKLCCWSEVISGLEMMTRRYPRQSFTKDNLLLATIYLSRLHNGSLENELKAHFSPEKAFACLMECVQHEKAKSEEFYEEFPEYRDLLNGLIDLKLNSGRKAHEFFNNCTKVLASCKEPSRMFDSVILPALSAHFHIHHGNADLAMDAIKEIKDISSTLADYYLARLSLMKKEIYRAVALYKSLISQGIPVYKELLDIFIELKEFKLTAATAFAAEHFYSQHNCVGEASYWGLLAEEYHRQESADSARKAQKLKTEQHGKVETQTQVDAEENMPQTQEAHSTNKEPSAAESRQPERPVSVKPKTKKPEPQFPSAESHYYQAQSMIQKYKYDSRSDITEKNISDQFNTALHDHPGDLWILHSSGWWNFEQNEYYKAKADLLKGLQIALGKQPSWKVPSSNQKQRVLTRIILSMFIDAFEKSKASTDPEAYQYQARDIAAFLSAYAHILVADGLTVEASQFRNAADRLDDRRGANALERLKTLIVAKIELISQKNFEQRKRASLTGR